MNEQPILVLGSTGYIGSAFVAECELRGINYYAAKRAHDFYDDPTMLRRLIQHLSPSMVVNCAAFIPAKSVDLCKDSPIQTVKANVWLPAQLGELCEMFQIPLMHFSTGCLYNEAKEYAEDHTPTRGWRGYCGFYVGTKIAAEEIVKRYDQHYILRIRLPFDEVDNPRNYLSKLASFKTVYPHLNSLSHRGDVVKAALDLWALRAPFGTYHLANPGFSYATTLVGALRVHGILVENPEIKECHGTTGCTLSTKKLLDSGVKIRTVAEALVEATTNWKPANV